MQAHSNEDNNIENRFCNTVNSLFPRRKKKPSAYSLPWRYFPNYDPDSLTPAESSNMCNGTDCSNTQNTGTAGPDGGNSDSQLPSYLHILRHHRKLLKGQKFKNVKSIYDTHDVTGVYSHSSLLCAQGEFEP